MFTFFLFLLYLVYLLYVLSKVIDATVLKLDLRVAAFEVSPSYLFSLLWVQTSYENPLYYIIIRERVVLDHIC